MTDTIPRLLRTLFSGQWSLRIDESDSWVVTVDEGFGYTDDDGEFDHGPAVFMDDSADRAARALEFLIDQEEELAVNDFERAKERLNRVIEARRAYAAG